MHGGTRQHGQPEVWAFLTIITFPIVLIATDIIGVEGLWPFGFALLATFSVLVLEAIVRGRLWPFEDRFVNHIGHPDTPLRILIFLGATLLILETTLIFAVTTDRRFDPALLQLVIGKQCASRQNPTSDKICRFLQQSFETGAVVVQKASLTSYAIRTHAASTWFPKDGLVTCAERIVGRSTDPAEGTARQVHIVHCTSWKVTENGALAQKSKKTAYAGSSLNTQGDGIYRVTGWSEDPNSREWTSVLGSIAQTSRDRVTALAILPEFETLLQAEALAEAQALLKK